MTRVAARAGAFLGHLVAGGLALLFAWRIAHTGYFNTGVQFVAPLAVILSAHLLWIGVSRGYTAGYASLALARMVATSLAVGFIAILAAAFAPMPAAASGAGEVVGAILLMLVCLAIVAFVVGVAALAVYVAAIIVIKVVRALRRRGPDGPSSGSDGNKLYDAGVIAMAFILIITASLEGTTPALSFAASGVASSTVAVAAPPESVWRQIGRATSPKFPLPAMLKIIPRPVSVSIDEGTEIGARRVVHFAGREGEGDLTLQVIRRSDAEAEFRAVSDTTPIAKWVRQKSLVFQVQPSASGALLTVSLHYDRLLSPAWFFQPFVHTSADLAVDVLARDTRDRAERR